MINSYRFFQNKECEYFPCHKTENEEEFNCLFCYCPLYREKKCIGNPVWFLNAKGQKMKDCSQCEVIHRSEAYDKVMQQLQRQDEIISLNIGNLREDIWERMAQIASWEQMDKRTHRQHKGMAVSSIGEILERNKYLYRVSILLQPFSGQCVEDGYFSFGNDKMQCQVLSRIDRRQVETGYLYAFHAPEYEVEESKALLTQYYWEIFQIACLDVVREWLREYLQRKHSMYEKRFCSPAFGAGFYGMELSASEKMLQLLENQQVNDRLPLLLPENVTVAHKTGNLSGICIADVGIVELKDSPYLICVICNDPYTDAGATSEIAELSQSVYRAFAG